MENEVLLSDCERILVMPSWRTLTFLGVGVLMLVLLAILGRGLFVSFVGKWYGPPDTVTDIARYATIRDGWSGGLAEHFPSAIPSEAKNVRMAFFPGFLQGGAFFQVRMTLPPEQVAAMEAKYSAKATHTFHGGNSNVHMNLPGGVPTTFDHTNGTKSAAFPGSFTLYVLQAKPAGTSDHSWNHGSNAGVAVSRASNEVVYWCESW